MINEFVHSIYWEGVSGIVNIIGVLISFILTFTIINQTKNLSKSQSELEKKLSEQQNMIRKRQIRIDVFPYKREIYLNLFKVLEFTNFLETNIFKLKLEEKSGKELYTIYNMAKDTFLGDTITIMQSLRESEYILPPNISPTILQIHRHLDEICSNFIALGTLQDIIPAELLDESKIEIISSIKGNCSEINTKVNFIQSIMPNELNISKLDG